MIKTKSIIGPKLCYRQVTGTFWVQLFVNRTFQWGWTRKFYY